MQWRKTIFCTRYVCLKIEWQSRNVVATTTLVHFTDCERKRNQRGTKLLIIASTTVIIWPSFLANKHPLSQLALEGCWRPNDGPVSFLCDASSWLPEQSQLQIVSVNRTTTITVKVEKKAHMYTPRYSDLEDIDHITGNWIRWSKRCRNPHTRPLLTFTHNHTQDTLWHP